jgi:hypothetical protein
MAVFYVVAQFSELLSVSTTDCVRRDKVYVKVTKRVRKYFDPEKNKCKAQTVLFRTANNGETI